MLALLRGAVQGEVVVRSERYVPVRTDLEAPLVQLARQVSPTGRVRGFGGVSDMYFVRHVPGVVMGPGTSAASHAPDEWVAVDQVDAAVTAYATLAERWLAAAGAIHRSQEARA